jgi:sigma-B regulation protein RsbU (phosphoserine phosphatase)
MKRLRPRAPWRARLSWRLVLAIGIPLVLVEGVRMYVGYHEDRVEAQEQVHAYLAEVTRQRAETLASRLAEVMQATRSAAWFLGSEHLALDRGTLLDILAGVVHQLPLIYGSAVAFPPASGHGAYYVRQAPDGLVSRDYARLGIDYSHQEWFRRATASTVPTWSPPYFDAGIGDARMVTYSVPWHLAGGGTAVITADIALDTLDIGWSSPWGGATRIVDADGAYLAHSGDFPPLQAGISAAAQALGIPELADVGHAMQRGEAGILRAHDPRFGGGAVWVSWTPVSGTGWNLMAILYEDRVLANARQQVLHQLLLSMAALLLVLGILVWATRRLTRPLGDLRRVARAVRHGDHSQRTGVAGTGDEIGRFAQAFDGMLDALEATQAERLAEARERQRMEGELAAARDIQRRLLPPPWPEWSARAGATPGFRFHGVCEPATLMSGDFYDVYRLDADSIALVVADVCGKGTAAALYMALVRTRLRDFDAATHGPAATLHAVNRALVEEGHGGMFVTVFLGHYRYADGRLAYACAGHPPPLLARADGRIETLECRGGLVGAFDDIGYAESELQLGPGDTLLAYSDGITEAGTSRDDLYGVKRLEAKLAAGHARPLEALRAGIVAGVLAWSNGEPGDDITLLAVRSERDGAHAPAAPCSRVGTAPY